ncbi:MAG: GNAT family N-acetyltransferase [Gammaproteobacteria bacterium]|nr:GNAT family N-acetyltransferase [Gammaproteobacteria bacterium]
MAKRSGISIPERVGDAQEVDYSADPVDSGPLPRDRIPIRGIRAGDLRALLAIDRETTGRDRSAYLQAKVNEALNESDVRVSLVAEIDGRVVGFVMARVELGDFGHTDPTAELDTIGVAPDCKGQGVGRALLSQLIANLSALRVERILTEVSWDDPQLLLFLARCGFHPSSCLPFERAVD